MAPDLYGTWKRDRLAVALDRVGIAATIEPLLDVHGEGRRRVVFHARTVEGAVRVGFMEARSHTLVPIERCPITAPGLARAAHAAEALARILAGNGKPLDVAVTASAAGLDIDLRGSGPPGGRLRAILVARATELDLARLSVHGEILVERRPPALPIGRASVVPPPGSFLQATAAGEEALAAAVLAGIGRPKRVADLFSGIGPFTLRLAGSAEVHAVDADPAMLAALDRAWRGAPGLRRVTTEARDLFRRPLLPPELDRFDAIVLDPPRSGAEAQVRQLIPSSLSRVILVSCDPGTFARDAAILAAGGFTSERIVPVDQFKWSAHLEIVGTFARQARGVRRRSRHG